MMPATEKAARIARALAELAIVETTPGRLAAVTGMSAREIGVAFRHARAELDEACAALGVTIVAYRPRGERDGARIEFTRNTA